MSIVPTAALNFADGGVSQGFATMYDLKVLNPELVAGGQVTNIPLNSVNTSYEA